MKNIIYSFVFSFVFSFWATNIKAQDEINYNTWTFKLNAGYNIGGSSPLPLPQEVRKIVSFTPAFFAPHIAFEANYKFTPQWGISAQASFDVKSFKVTDRVQYLHTKMTIGEGSQTGVFEGLFTGRNKTKLNNSYFSIPIMIAYYPTEKWTVQAGLYFSYLYSGKFEGSASDGYLREGGPTGEKIEVTHAEFDFSDDLINFDWGTQLAGEMKLSRKFGLRGQVAWSFLPVFPSDFKGVPFKMYNIYGTIGLSYILDKF